MISLKSVSFDSKDQKGRTKLMRSKSSNNSFFKKRELDNSISVNGDSDNSKKMKRLGSEVDHRAATKLQKFYKSYRTRRNLADCAVVVEELWWKEIDSAALTRSSVSFFNSEKAETAVSRWERARIRAARLGKGLCKDEKAQKLALRHWLEAKYPIDDDIPPNVGNKKKSKLDSSATVDEAIDANGQAKNTTALIKDDIKEEEEEDQKLNKINKVEKEEEEEEIEKPLSSKIWTTGAGPRISCVRDYPTQLQFHALEQVNLSPRVKPGPSFATWNHGPIPSPRPSPRFHLSPRLACMGLASPIPIPSPRSSSKHY